MTGKLTTKLLVACSDVSVPQSTKENQEDLILKALANCQHLRLNNRNLTDLNKLYLCPNTRILHAFDNKVSNIDVLCQVRAVNAAYLNNNLISSLPNDLGTHMKHLTRLYINRNCISMFKGWSTVQSAVLEELHIAGQAGEYPLQFEEASMKALSNCLRVLNVSHNKLSDLKPLLPLRSLRSFFANHNAIEDLSELKAVADRNPSLLVFAAICNPCTTGVAKLRACRDAIVLACPAIEVVNDKDVSVAERTFLREKSRRLEQTSIHI